MSDCIHSCISWYISLFVSIKEYTKKGSNRVFLNVLVLIVHGDVIMPKLKIAIKWTNISARYLHVRYNTQLIAHKMSHR